MKNHNAVKTMLDTQHAVKALPELIVDWNMNRYYEVNADNYPTEEDEGYDIEIFPVESICEPLRPTKGINKARTGSSVTGGDYNSYSKEINPGRFYVSDQDDTYKYWTSPVLSDSSGNLLKTKPYIIYTELVDINKIVITTENTWATASEFNIQTTSVEEPTDSDWNTIANQTNVGNNWKASGQIVLYWTGVDDGWKTATMAFDGPVSRRTEKVDGTGPRTTQVRGIRIVVTKLESGYQKPIDNVTQKKTDYVKNGQTVLTNGSNSHFDLIEISGRLEADLSGSVINASTTFDLAEASTLYPVGTITTNEANVTLSNLYKSTNGKWKIGLFNENNPESPYRNLIDANAEMTLNWLYYDSNDNFVSRVREFVMYSDVWGGQAGAEVNVALADYSKFFNRSEATLRAAMWEGLKVSQIIWRILDSVGFVNYQIDTNIDLENDHVIPIFYTNGESNVWEVLDELARAAQSAIYFDGYGILQVKTRSFAFSKNDSPVYELTSNTNNGSTLENIVSLEVGSEYQPNHFTISYQKTNWGKVTRGTPAMQQVWNPEGDTVTLRASALMRDLNVDDTTGSIFIPASDVAFWPYEGIMNVEGELVKYKGKVYIYYTGDNGETRNTIVIKNQDEYNSRNAKTPVGMRHKNHFNGALKVEERGYWNSEPRNHFVEANGYTARQFQNGNVVNIKSGFRHRKSESRVELVSGPRFESRSDMILATRGVVNSTPFFNYGTRFRLLAQKGRTTQMGGMVIHNSGSKEDGYYFEFVPSQYLDAAKRKSREEFALYYRQNGKEKILDTVPCAIGENIDYELDIEFATVSGSHQIRVWLNGKLISNKTISGADRVAANGKFGMFARGRTRIEYEYLYALANEQESPMLEDFSFLDKVERGYRGSQWDREYVYDWRTTRRRVKKNIKKYKTENGVITTYYTVWKKLKKRWNKQFFDEFGPIVHEVREFDVTFDPAPVQHSRLYLTNDWSACVTEYSATPFGAKFIIANTSRRNAVIHGEDSLSFSGTDSTINQVLTVFGRALKVDDAEEVVAKNDVQIRRRGKIESEISSPWIQSKSMAEDVSKWLNDNFSYGNETVTVEIFGNPLIELADVVSVDFPENHINGDYFVVGISNSFENGITTTLTLRERVLVDTNQ